MSKETTSVIYFLLGLALVTVIAKENNTQECYRKTFRSNDSFVCVCNVNFCDEFTKIEPTSQGLVTVFRSDKKYDRFKHSILKFAAANKSEPIDQIVIIDRNVTHQSIFGFGGAITDAAGINIFKLGPKLVGSIVKDYFGENGLRYTMLRVPIGGSDFSTRPYTYDDTEKEDFDLKNFRLAPEDNKYKIPVIQMAKNESKSYIQDLRIFASPWSAPAWMKTNHRLNGKGELKGNPGGIYYQAWANYFVKFLEEYKKHTIEFWGLTIQNEPFDGNLNNFSFNCLGMTPEEQRDFIIQTLGPKLNSSGYGPEKLKLMIMDDQRPLMKQWAESVLTNSESAKYVSGIAFHWYFNTLSSPDVLQEIHRKFPNYFLLSTEACEGSSPLESEKVSLGNWQRAENYALDILTDLQYFTNGWVDWNLALDMEGGPNWVSNFVDSPILVNEQTQEYYKQPMYYALAHFTRFLPIGSIRLDTKSQKDSPIEVVAFKTPLNSIVLIALNRYESDIKLQIQDVPYGQLDITIIGHSIQTFVWFD